MCLSGYDLARCRLSKFCLDHFNLTGDKPIILSVLLVAISNYYPVTSVELHFVRIVLCYTYNYHSKYYYLGIYFYVFTLQKSSFSFFFFLVPGHKHATEFDNNNNNIDVCTRFHNTNFPSTIYTCIIILMCIYCPTQTETPPAHPVPIQRSRY